MNTRSKNRSTLTDMWNDQVFIDRQKEIATLSQQFSEAIDKLVSDKPFNFEINVPPNDEEEEYEYVEEDEEEEEDTINGNALILIHEIETIDHSITQLISGISPRLIKKDVHIRNTVQNLYDLQKLLLNMRIRAENLLSC